MVQQTALLNVVDNLIDAALAVADTARAPTRRRMQAFVLTSPAFLNMTRDDAAIVMGIMRGTINALLNQLAQSHPHVRMFNDMWTEQCDDTPTIRRLSGVDEEVERIVHVF